MCKKDSGDGELTKSGQIPHEKRGVGAVLIGQGHEWLWGEVDEGISDYEGGRVYMEKGGFIFSCARKEDGLKFWRLLGELPLKTREARLTVSVVIFIRFDNINGRFGHGRGLRPDNGIKKDRAFFAHIGSRPKFSFAGGVVSVPSKETRPMILQGGGLGVHGGKVAA